MPPESRGRDGGLGVGWGGGGGVGVMRGGGGCGGAGGCFCRAAPRVGFAPAAAGGVRVPATGLLRAALLLRGTGLLRGAGAAGLGLVSGLQPRRPIDFFSTYIRALDG